MPKERKPSQLKPLKTLRIFCEGEQTEPNYLKGYISTLNNSKRKSVIAIEKTTKNTAVQLVEEAIKTKNSSDSLPGDEFWVVYDREAVDKYSDEFHDKARKKADRAGIRIALTNVCFEYWLLIHFVDTNAPFSSYDDLISKSALRAQMKIICGQDFEKSQRSIFNLLQPYLSEARERARRLNLQGLASAEIGREQPHHINPHIGIIDLLDAIDEFN